MKSRRIIVFWTLLVAPASSLHREAERNDLHGTINQDGEAFGPDNFYFENEQQSHRRLGCRSQSLPRFDPEVRPKTVVSFYALGDTPYSLRDRHCLNHQLRGIEHSKGGARFTVHVGDIKDSTKRLPCDRQLYSDVADIFRHPVNSAKYDPRNTFFVVGDNEFIDCHNFPESISLWKEHFGQGNKYGFGSFSTKYPYVNRQLSAGGLDRSDNFAFFLNKVLFIGLNIVGGKEKDFSRLYLTQNFEWTKFQLEKFSKKGMEAAVIFAHAVLKPGFRREYFGDPLFSLLKEQFETLPVAYVHGDGHEYCVKYLDPENPNFVDIMVDEGGYANPLLVSVLKNPKTGELIFSTDRRGGLYTPDAIEEEYIPDCPLIKEKTWDINQTVPYNHLRWVGKKSYRKLGECEGMCYSDKGCSSGLRCALRKATEKVPGCSGLGKSGKAYCYDPKKGEFVQASAPSVPSPKPTANPTRKPKAFKKKTTLSPVVRPPPLRSKDEPALTIMGIPPFPRNSLGRCEGPCKSNSDCKDGYYCFKRKKFEPVPSCSGEGKRDKDYCVPIGYS